MQFLNRHNVLWAFMRKKGKTYFSFADFHKDEGIGNGVSSHNVVSDGCCITDLKENPPVNSLK